MSLLTIGTMAFDDIQTPFGHAEKVIGGACTYITWSASYFTNSINVSSIVGHDFPQEEIVALETRGADLSGVEVKMDGKTFFWAGKYHDNMMTPAIQAQVMDQLDGSQKLVAMDTMNFWMDIAMDELKKVIARVDLLTINDEEARQLSGEYSLLAAAKKIHEMGPKYLIIKKGEHGAMLFHEGKIFYAPALPLQLVKDPTGAGDTFAGGLMGYLAKTDDVSFENMKTAIIYGSTMASFCVEEFSIDNLKNLNSEAIEKRAQRFKEMVSFEL